MTELLPAYVGYCIEQLNDYYAELGITDQKFAVNRIPGKLLKLGLLSADMTPNTAADVCLTYAHTKQSQIKLGTPATKAGDSAAQIMLATKEDKQVSEQTMELRHDKTSLPIVEKFELTAFINDRGSGAIIDKETGLTASLSIQAHTNDPDVLFDAVEYVFAVARKLEATGHYEINPEVLQRDHRSAFYEAKHELSGQRYSEGYQQLPDNNLPPSQGNAQPKHTSQTESKMLEITGVGLIKSKSGDKIGYKFYKAIKDDKGNIKQEMIMPGGLAEYRPAKAEIVLKALGFSAEVIGSLEAGDQKSVKVKGIMAECIQEPKNDNSGQTVTKIVAYHLPDGTVVK
jgi:hypothetical protein